MDMETERIETTKCRCPIKDRRAPPTRKYPGKYEDAFCSKCKLIKPARFVENPFYAEIYLNDEPEWLCDRCWEDWHEEI